MASDDQSDDVEFYDEEDQPAPQGSKKLAVVVFAVLASICVWQIVTRTYVGYLAQAYPERALDWNSSDPVALTAVARKLLRTSSAALSAADPKQTQSVSPKTEPVAESRLPAIAEIAAAAAQAAAASAPAVPVHQDVLDQVTELATRALRADPMNARALSLLGQVAVLRNDTEKSLAWMTAARRLSLREWPAVVTLLQRSLEQRDYAAAMVHADTLMRTRYDLTRVVVPMLAKAAENKDLNQAVKELLATNPPWRPHYFATMTASISDGRTPLGLLLHLKDTPFPPKTAELGPYLTYLMNKKLYDTAYYTWLQFLPPEQLATAGTLFNGSFETDTTGLPFDWKFASAKGTTVAIEARPNETGRALSLTFTEGRAAFKPITQTVVLSPGDYTLSVQSKGKITSPRGLVWRVVCAPKPSQILGQTELINGAFKTWTTQSAKITVPDRDCGAQTLKLEHDARSASEQFIAGSIWFDDVEIKPDLKQSSASIETPSTQQVELTTAVTGSVPNSTPPAAAPLAAP